MPLDPDRLQAALAAVAGGVFYGMFHLTTMLFTGIAPARADILKAVANVLFAVLAGALVAYFLAPSLLQMVPWKEMRDLHSVGFVLGASAWELAPFAYRKARVWAAAKAGKEPSQ
jgi:hypothetical protein